MAGLLANEAFNPARLAALLESQPRLLPTMWPVLTEPIRVVGSDADATAYVLTRLPATYAACARVFEEAAERAPGFEPASLLDAGAGPGGAGWAALEAWPCLRQATLLDSNRAFLDMAQKASAEFS